ncbi:MAG: hypothetical protein ABL868_09630, partial [Sulfuriferula sp.]
IWTDCLIAEISNSVNLIYESPINEKPRNLHAKQLGSLIQTHIKTCKKYGGLRYATQFRRSSQLNAVITTQCKSIVSVQPIHAQVLRILPTKLTCGDTDTSGIARNI